MAFTDVDLPSSARQCLENIWPRLSERGAYFSHDVGFIKVLQELTGEALWRDVLHEPVPIIYGAGYGLGDTSRMLGFMVKGRDLSGGIHQQPDRRQVSAHAHPDVPGGHRDRAGLVAACDRSCTRQPLLPSPRYGRVW